MVSKVLLFSKLVWLVFISLLYLAIPTNAHVFINQINDDQQNGYQEEPLRIVSGLVKPPFIIQEQVAGLEIEIIKSAFRTQGKEVQFIHVPLARSTKGYELYKADGISILPSNYKGNNAYSSKPYVIYQNIVVTLNVSGVTLKNISDFSSMRVASFQMGRELLGDAFSASVAKSPYYVEVADQEKQLRMLFDGTVDAIVIDKNIFTYLLNLQTDGIFNQTTTTHYFFPTRPYVAGFRTKKLRDSFNKGLAIIQQNGTYNRIVNKYSDVEN